MPELRIYWADEQEIHLPECHCGNLVALHFEARHMPPYCYCRGSGGVNCSFYETAHNCAELRIFMASKSANVFTIFAGYIDSVPRLHRARVVGDNDADPFGPFFGRHSKSRTTRRTHEKFSMHEFRAIVIISDIFL